MRARGWPTWVPYIYPFYRWKNWGLEALIDWITCQGGHRGVAELVDGYTWGKGWRGVGKSPCTWYWASLYTYSLHKKCGSIWWLEVLQAESVEPWLCLPAPAPKAATHFRCWLTDAFYLLSSSQQGQSLWAWFSSWPGWLQCASLEELRLAFQPKMDPW